MGKGQGRSGAVAEDGQEGTAIKASAAGYHGPRGNLMDLETEAREKMWEFGLAVGSDGDFCHRPERDFVRLGLSVLLVPFRTWTAHIVQLGSIGVGEPFQEPAYAGND
jgi:hypothetical protein